MSTTDRTPTTRRPTPERLPIDEQFWPVNLLLLVLGAVVSGAIAVRADFFTPRLLGSGWTWLAIVWLIVGLVTLGAWRLGDRAARRLQLSAVLAILLILFLLTYFGDREVLWLDLAQQQRTNDPLAAEEPEEQPPIPAIVSAPDEPKPQLEFEKIVPVEVAPEAIAQEEPIPQPKKEIEAPQQQPKPEEQLASATPLPRLAPLPVERERTEQTAPRQSLSESQLSRQLTPAKPQAGEPAAPQVVGVSTSDKPLDAQAATLDAPRLSSGIEKPLNPGPALEASSPTPAAPPKGSDIRRLEAAPQMIASAEQPARGRALGASAASISAPVDVPLATIAGGPPGAVPTEAMHMAQRQAASSPLSQQASASHIADARVADLRPIPGGVATARQVGPIGSGTDESLTARADLPAAGPRMASIPQVAVGAPQIELVAGTLKTENRPGPAEAAPGSSLGLRRDSQGALSGPTISSSAAGLGSGEAGSGSHRIAAATSVGRAVAVGQPGVAPSGTQTEPLVLGHRGVAGGLPTAGQPVGDIVAAPATNRQGTGGGGTSEKGSGGAGTGPEAGATAVAAPGPVGIGGGNGPPSGIAIAALEPGNGFGGTSSREGLRAGGSSAAGSGSGVEVVSSGTGAGPVRRSSGQFSAAANSDAPQLPGDPASTRSTASVGTGPADGSGLGGSGGGGSSFAGGGSGPSLVRGTGAIGTGTGEGGDGSGTGPGGSPTLGRIARAEYGLPNGSDVKAATWAADGKVGGSGRTVGPVRAGGSSLRSAAVAGDGEPGLGGPGDGGSGGAGSSNGAERLGPVQSVAGERGGTGTDAIGPTVLVPAESGPGGLGNAVASFSGNISPRAQPQSDVVVASTDERFLRRDIGGPRVTAGVAPVEARGSFIKRTEGPGNGRGRATQPEQIDVKIALALDFLQRHQRPDGSWSLHGTDTNRPNDPSEIHSDVAATGLALLAFLGDRHHHLETQGEYNATIHNAIQYLIKHQKPTGEVFVEADAKSNYTSRTYSHAIATLALCEAFGMTGDPKVREPAQRAVDFAISTQHKKLGGWRYLPQKTCDTSVTGWMFAALDAGKRAQLDVPRTAFEGVDRWLELATAPRSRGALYVYNPEAVDELVPVKGVTYDRAAQRRASPVNTAVGLYVRLTRGWSPTDPRIQEGADYLMKNLPEHTAEGRNTYYWYYATQVLYHVQGPRWQKWQKRLSAELEETQVRKGPLAGSWDPEGRVPDKWGATGGRIFVTAVNLLSLEAGSRVADSPTPLDVR